MSDSAQKNLYKFIFILMLLPISIYFWAQAYYAVWAWFAVPLGAPTVSMAHAYGLSLLLRTFTYQVQHTDVESEGAVSRAITYGVVMPWLCIFTGYVIVHWIGI